MHFESARPQTAPTAQAVLCCISEKPHVASDTESDVNLPRRQARRRNEIFRKVGIRGLAEANGSGVVEQRGNISLRWVADWARRSLNSVRS